MKAIGIISFAVFCVISMLLFNPWAALCIMVILLMMTVELAGFLGVCQIKFNPVSAVSLITAVGIGVEFTAHVVFAFLTAPARGMNVWQRLLIECCASDSRHVSIDYYWFDNGLMLFPVLYL
uniref:Uncharacterized protein n=1 Tax=Ditylenchus dipsaci TaxID=166011 RepID=A0A915DJ50_9BILA